MKQILGSMRKKTLILFSLLTITFANVALASTTHAEEGTRQGFSMTPMKQQAIITPGETFNGSFTIFNPASNQKDFPYSVSIKSFYVDNDYNTVFDQKETFNQITDWITIDSPLTGTLASNEKTEIYYTIDVPATAPAGGQYAAIVVTSNNDVTSNGSAIIEKTAIAHTIFAEITGSTTHSGEIIGATVPSFLLSGNISGESTVKNTGNTHGIATYKMQVFPLFSGEEVYTNVESPETHIVLPNRSFYNKIEWANTPAFGIFNVKYSVEFEGIVTEVSKMVIICPVWLIIVLLIVIAGIVIGAVTFVRKKR